MSANIIFLPGLRTARYGAVILLGFALDFGITLTLSRLGGLPLEMSAAIGFLLALAFNYALFEFFVFPGEDSAFSTARLSQTVLAAGTALSVRVGVIWLVGKVLGNTLPETVAAILFGGGASVLVNYLFVSWVFARPRRLVCMSTLNRESSSRVPRKACGRRRGIRPRARVRH